MPNIWVISDGRGLTGNLNACLGVADALKGHVKTFDIKDIEQQGCVKKFLQNTLDLSHSTCRDAPNYIITFYKNTAPVAAEIKSLLKKKTDKPVFLIQIRTPGGSYEQFDLIAAPTHQDPISGDNVIPIIGAPHRVTDLSLQEGAAQWRDQMDRLKDKKKIMVVLGGDTTPLANCPEKGGAFTAEEAAKLAKQLNTLAQKQDAYLLVTNSPRTNSDAWKAFMNEITVDGYFHDVHMDTKRSERGNPYLGMLAVADEVVVTADSTSMLSESIDAGKTVFVACSKAANVRAEHERFEDIIIENGYAALLGEPAAKAQKDTLNAAASIATEAKKRYAELEQAAQRQH